MEVHLPYLNGERYGFRYGASHQYKKNIVFLFAYILAFTYGNKTIIFQVIYTLSRISIHI